MKRSHAFARRATLSGLALGAAPLLCAADTLPLSQSPLFLVNRVLPNVMVLYDNSQSMDGTMAGKLISGADPNTRGNIARRVLSSTIASYRTAFQWGLSSFDTKGSPALYTTYGYYFGGDSQVVFTNDCVAGVSASNGGLRCVANPEPGNGYGYVTFNQSGDDPSINDVLYSGDFGPQMWGIGIDGTSKYYVYRNRAAGSGAGWSSTDFTNAAPYSPWQFTETDAGFLPKAPPNTREFWIKRAWGYNNDISGSGKINQSIQPDSDAQYNALMTLLAPETSTNSSELKNNAVFTPLTGSVNTVRSYFGGANTPITASCQKNFVLLATDGNPTGKTDGSMYSLADVANTQNADGSWTLGVAPAATRDAVTQLRNVVVAAGVAGVGGKTFDINTYVVGLGDSVANPSSIATLDALASAGGTGKAYLASDEAALANAFRDISNSIVKATASAAAVALNSGAWNAGDKAFQARFSSADWSGQLLSFNIDASGAMAKTANWDAGALLKAPNADTGRQILTYNAGSKVGVPFRWPANASAPAANEIDKAMVDALNADSQGALRLAWLRGDHSRESAACSGCGAPLFRDRPTSVLGDIVNSAPVYVSGGTNAFRDTLEAQAYSAYAAQRATETPVVYVGANDGMLHAFNATNGTELMAYVPHAVASRLAALSATTYNHQYTVDGSPSVGDVFYGGAWHTVLVGTMGAGAPGLFALDVTDPSKFTEANAAKVVRWELANDADVGNVFGQPLLAKTKSGKWMALTGNGYNSANGHAVLLAVDIESGAVTRIDTQVGGGNGLSAIVAISSQGNDIADVVYAGDLKGNLWKFDLSATDPSAWSVAYTRDGLPAPLFTAGTDQPITARPDVTGMPAGQPGVMVTFGTGRYLAVGDTSTTKGQALYGIWDNGSPATAADLESQKVVGSGKGADGSTYRVTTHAVDVPADVPAGSMLEGDDQISTDEYYAKKRGWVLPLPDSGERVVSEPTVRSNRVIVSSIVPSADPCSYGGTGWLIAVDAATGNRSDTATFDTDANGNANKTDFVMIDGVAVPLNTSAVAFGSMPTSPTVASSSSTMIPAIVSLSDSGTGTAEMSKTLKSRRAAWEQLP